MALKYYKAADKNLVVYSDADWAGDLDDRHSTSGNVFLMAGGAISWVSKKQATVCCTQCSHSGGSLVEKTPH